VFNEVSTGATDDIDKATDVARNMMTRLGMHEKLEQMTYDEPRQSFLGENILGSTPRNYAEETAREIDCAVCELMTEARERALGMLRENRTQLEQGDTALLARETRHLTPGLHETTIAARYEPLFAFGSASTLNVSITTASSTALRARFAS